jgi:hypothetical protein
MKPGTSRRELLQTLAAFGLTPLLDARSAQAQPPATYPRRGLVLFTPQGTNG